MILQKKTSMLKKTFSLEKSVQKRQLESSQ